MNNVDIDDGDDEKINKNIINDITTINDDDDDDDYLDNQHHKDHVVVVDDDREIIYNNNNNNNKMKIITNNHYCNNDDDDLNNHKDDLQHHPNLVVVKKSITSSNNNNKRQQQQRRRSSLSSLSLTKTTAVAKKKNNKKKNLKFNTFVDRIWNRMRPIIPKLDLVPPPSSTTSTRQNQRYLSNSENNIEKHSKKLLIQNEKNDILIDQQNGNDGGGEENSYDTIDCSDHHHQQKLFRTKKFSMEKYFENDVINSDKNPNDENDDPIRIELIKRENELKKYRFLLSTLNEFRSNIINGNVDQQLNEKHHEQQQITKNGNRKELDCIRPNTVKKFVNLFETKFADNSGVGGGHHTIKQHCQKQSSLSSIIIRDKKCQQQSSSTSTTSLKYDEQQRKNDNNDNQNIFSKIKSNECNDIPNQISKTEPCDTTISSNNDDDKKDVVNDDDDDDEIEEKISKNKAIKQSSIESKSIIDCDILISPEELINNNNNNDDDDNIEDNEMASITTNNLVQNDDHQVEKSSISTPPSSSLHRLCNMFQDMIDQLKKTEIHDSELLNDNNNIIDDYDNDNNDVKQTFLHPISYDDDHDMDDDDDFDHDDDNKQTIIEQSELQKPSTKQQKRKRIVSPTVSIVLHVYHRSGIRGHRMGRCVRYYRIKSKNAKQFIRQIEMKIMKKQRMTKRNLIPKQQSKFEQTSIVDETNLENRNKRSQSTGDVLIHSQLCRLTDNRAHSLTLDDMEIFETSKPIQEDQQIEQQQQQLNDNNQKQKDTDTDSTADNDNDDDNFFQTTNDLNKKLPLRSSWRRKNFYKRRESLDEYLQRKVFKIDQTNIDQSSSSSSTTTTTATSSSSSLMMDNNRILKFQSNNPWLNYIKTCGRKITWQSLTNEQILMYESMFELIVTEKSYLVRLENLISLLKRMPELAEILSSYDQKILFGNLQPLFNINQSLYNDFARSFHEDCFMHHMFVVFEKYFNEKFEPYIEYIRGQNERDQVMANKKLALAIPKDIKMMQSSFITPMQRITRYPLLLKTILDRMKKLETKKSNNDEQLNELKNNVQKCFESATKFSMRCDNALNELFKLQKLIEFRKKLTGNFAHLKDNLVISGREIYRQASIKIIKHICLLSNDEFKDVRTHHSMLILLTDLLMLADYKQRKDKYKVIECERLDRVEFSCGSLVTSLSNDDSGSATLNTIKFLKSNQTDVYQFVFALSDELEQFFNKFKELKFNLLLINQQQLQQPQQLQQQQQQPQRSLSLQSTTITDDSHRQNHQQKPNHKLIISDENGKISCKNLIVCPINSLPINVENNENGHHDNSGDDDKDVKDKIFKAKFNASF